MSPKYLFRRRYTRAGAAPGELSPQRGAAGARIYLLQWDADRVDERELEGVDAIAALDRSQGVTWIDVRGSMDEASLTALGELFGLHPLAIADTANVGQRPKVEEYDGHVYCVVRMVTYTLEGGIYWEQVSLFLGSDFVLTFQETDEDCLDPLRDRIRAGRKLIRSSKHDYIAAMVIDAIVDGYFPILEVYGDDLEELEEKIMINAERDDLTEIYRIKRELMIFRRAAWPLRDTLSQLMRDRPALLSQSVLPYLRDTTDHLMQIVDIVETYRELSTSFIDVYMSSISFRTNEIMRLLTVMASIFIPLTFLAGIYGMNFDTTSPFNLPELSWRYGYLAFWGVSIAVGGGLAGMFYRLGWLGRPD